MSARSASRARRVAWALLALALVFGWLGLGAGSSSELALRDAGRGVLATLGLAEPLEGARQVILELRLWRTLVTLGVGGALAYSGALLQGLFRNSLASPSLLGISSGAMLGASLAVLLVGGYGPDLDVTKLSGTAPVLITACGFAGALGAALLVTALASSGGRISVTTLLLVGIAINACFGGVIAAVQYVSLQDFELARAVFAWSFGTLQDRAPYHVGLLWACLAVAACAIPFVSRELDLFAGGEEDAGALGVNTAAVKFMALVAASLAAGVAVAVAGQIAFVGLIVPHVLRITVGAGHRRLLPLSLAAGGVFLLVADVSQRLALGEHPLKPGVLMSLAGGPFFLFVLLKNRKALQGW
ncbi:MAG: iron ABC transporter permease [Planctomycetes bacterium]|nr:iron ABC transporter permease [Planctomycetota bacterium]